VVARCCSHGADMLNRTGSSHLLCIATFLACTSLVDPDGCAASSIPPAALVICQHGHLGTTGRLGHLKLSQLELLMLTAWQPAGSGGGCGGGAAQVWAAAAAAQRFPRGQVHLSCACAFKHQPDVLLHVRRCVLASLSCPSTRSLKKAIAYGIIFCVHCRYSEREEKRRNGRLLSQVPTC
jgi:hypothetical protein